MRKVFCFLIGLISMNIHSQDIPKVVSGKIERVENFHSNFVTSRNVDIWLPEGYSNSEKYPVLYMHDGQMLYDPQQAWNKQSWNIDDVASQLIKENKIRSFIVVGIWNGNQTRHTDYFPQKAFEMLSQAEKDTVTAQLQNSGRTKETFQPQSDNYLKFIVKELKPYIDKKYSVYKDRQNTFIAGSSMGGLISIYAICEYPKIFGGAACLSTHWPGTFTMENNPVPDCFVKYLSKNLPNPKNHRIYFDYGDQTLDAMYPNLQKKVDEVMVKKGYSSQNWITKYFPGANHSENAWNNRLNYPLEFLLGK